MTPSCTSGVQRIVWLTLLIVKNVLAKCFALSTDHPGHLKLFRKYVSRKAVGKGRAVLEGVGLDSETIAACFNSHPLNEEEAVQAGLTKWCGGRGNEPPTWQVLFAAIEYAQIAKQHVNDLKKESGLFGKQCVCVCVCLCVCAYVWVCACACACACVCVCVPRTVQVATSCTYMCSGATNVWSVMQWTLLATC